MFTSSRQFSTLDDLQTFTPHDEKLRVNIIEILAAEEEYPEDVDTLCEQLKKYETGLLYLLANDPQIEKFLQTDAELNECWSMRLKNFNLTGKRMKSFDGVNVITAFSQLKGLLLLTKYNSLAEDDPKALALLNAACDIGMHNALIMRANRNIQLLKLESAKHDSADIKTYLAAIVDDAIRLSNQYWALGALGAAITFLNAVDGLYPIANNEMLRFFSAAKADNWQKTYESCPIVVMLLESAVENLYFCELIHDFEESNELVQKMNEGNIFLNYAKQFNSKEQLENALMKKLKLLNVPCIESFCKKAFEHAVQRVKETYPDFIAPHFEFKKTTNTSTL